MLIRIRLGSFYSKCDESRLFDGFNGISAIRSIKGDGRDLLLDISIRDLSSDSMRELIVLLWRYRIPLSPFRPLARNKRFDWLNNPKGVWYKSMFAGKEQTETQTGK